MTQSKPARSALIPEVSALSRLIAVRHIPMASVALLGFALTPVASAATINVGGGCSIVQAIQAANGNITVGTCTAGSGADVLVLPSGGTFTFNGTTTFPADGDNALPDITSAITIQGHGSTISRSNTATSDFRLFHVAGGGSLTLQETTVSGGKAGDSENNGYYSGGGIYVAPSGSLTLTNATVSGNYAQYYGGGLLVNGTAVISNSTISGNTAGSSGGGLYANGSTSLVLLNSTISGNSSSLLDPGFGGGGGLYINGSTATITNSTLSGNKATGYYGGGAYISGSTVTITNSTISGNTAGAGLGGGLHVDVSSTATARNTIVAAQTGGGDCSPDSSFSVGGTPNLDSGQGNCTGFTIHTTGFTLGSLAQNGGPTRTRALVAPGSSTAIDAGNDTVCAAAGPTGAGGLDQRGFVRNVGAHCDLGAVEFGATAPSTGGGGSGSGGGGGGGSFDLGLLLSMLGLWTARLARRRPHSGPGY